MIDANLNRAREALRVLEDFARFVLDDGEIAAELKDGRHELRAASEATGLDAATLAAWRDTPGDVGTATSSASEMRRERAADVAIAAGKRAGEALRVLEEAFKLLTHANALSSADRLKHLRYRVYSVEQRLLARLGSTSRPQWRLCVLITEALCVQQTWERVAELAIEGGADCLQLREKHLSDADLLARARRLVDIARATVPARGRACVIINDRADICLLSGADGVHLGQTDLGVSEVRKLVGISRLIGVSTSNIEHARRAATEGADCCGVGPMFATTTKHTPRVAGVGYLREYLNDAQASRVPHLAIGGVTTSNVAELASAGCQGVALSSAVCGAEKPREVCEALVGILSTRVGGDGSGAGARR